jgi:uncharacterized RDD family membrane protein YckC
MTESTLVLAPIGKRFTAQFIDELIAIGGGYSLVLGLKELVGSESNTPFLAMIFFALLYTLFADGMFKGQSIGKKLMNLYVVSNEMEQPCTYLQSFVRNSTYPLGIFDLIFLFGKERRRLGDRLASTKVLMKITR